MTMGYIIKNLTPAKIEIAPDVYIEPHQQLGPLSQLTDKMQDAADAGALQIKSDEETLEERRSDIDAINSFNPKE